MSDQVVERIVPMSEGNISCDTQVAAPIASSYDSQSIERERVRVFREKQAAETVSLKFESKQLPDTNQVFLQYATTDEGSSTRIGAIMCAAFGTASHGYVHVITGGTFNAQFVNKTDAADKANATVEALLAMKPQDIIEGQLCSRLVILVDQYNEYMRRAALPDQALEIRERYINCATKLMRVYNESLETLNKHRRKGEQKVTVQHVNINGGQAVVAGQFNQTGEGSNQKGKGAARVS